MGRDRWVRDQAPAGVAGAAEAVDSGAEAAMVGGEDKVLKALRQAAGRQKPPALPLRWSNLIASCRTWSPS
ncbi:MAG TPA: hypothetical protein DEB40_14295 [Elusimicrobia bacterium]|nr:hypothetical protein [Elusimicrobiota bacterium]HBT62903.1 hypothetical protein [Elusimicrobiota bacterium]